MERRVASHHPAGRAARAKAVDRILGSPGDVGVARQAQVIEAREAQDLAAGDPGPAAGDRLVGQPKGVVEPGLPQAGQPLLERLHLGKVIQLRHRGDRSRLRGRNGFDPVGRVKHPLSDTLHEVAAGAHVCQPMLVKPHHVAALDPSQRVAQSLLVDAGGGKARPERERAPARSRQHPLEFCDHHAGDHLTGVSAGMVAIIGLDRRRAAAVCQRARHPNSHRSAFSGGSTDHQPGIVRDPDTWIFPPLAVEPRAAAAGAPNKAAFPGAPGHIVMLCGLRRTERSCRRGRARSVQKRVACQPTSAAGHGHLPSNRRSTNGRIPPALN